MAIILTHLKTKKLMEFETPKELKEMLQFCNPLWLKEYKKQLLKNYDHIEVENLGRAIKIKRRIL